MGYQFGSYLIDYLLSLSYPYKKVTFTNSEECDVIIYTHFTRKQELWNQHPKPFIVWNGESYCLPTNIPNCSKKITVSSHDPNHDPNHDLDIPYAFFAFVEYQKRQLWLKYKNLKLSDKKLFGYCISADRGPNNRKNFVDIFTQKTPFTWSLGRYKSEKSKVDRVGGKWNDEKLLEKYSEFKFVLAAENTVKCGYLTEKIINVFSAGAVPIYIGDSTLVKKIFNAKSFICVEDFPTYEICIDYVLNLSEDKIVTYLSQPIFSNNREAEIFKQYNNELATCNKHIIIRIRKLLEIPEIFVNADIL